MSSAAAAVAPPSRPSPRKILHVITDLLTGGAESALVTLVTSPHWVNTVHHVVSMIPDGPNARRLRDAGIEVTELRFRRGVPDPIQVWRLSRLIKAQEPDIIQSWMYHADLAALAALKFSHRDAQTKLVWGIRCSDMDETRYGTGFRMVLRAGAYFSQSADAIVANSRAGLDVHERIGYRPRRAAMIHNGIDTQRFRPDSAARAAVRAELGIAPDMPVLAHVARVDPMKDHATFLKALGRLPGIAALAIGAGTENLAKQPGLHALGRRDDVARLLTAADFIVSSSAFGEGFSNALAEGMASGLAPVATDVGDTRLIVGDSGLVVPPGDPAALATAIRALLEEDAPSATIRRRRARARILEQFSVERAVRLFNDLYVELDRAAT